MDREKLANKFQWHIEKSAELWVVRNFYDGRIESEFKNYDEAFDRCNLLNIDLALKGLDEWNYNTDAAPESFLGLIKGCETGRLKQAVIDRSDAEDAYWLVAGDELSWAWDVIAWRALPTPPKDMGGVK